VWRYRRYRHGPGCSDLNPRQSVRRRGGSDLRGTHMCRCHLRRRLDVPRPAAVPCRAALPSPPGELTHHVYRRVIGGLVTRLAASAIDLDIIDGTRCFRKRESSDRLIERLVIVSTPGSCNSTYTVFTHPVFYLLVYRLRAAVAYE
jgi:hypothetical protein